ncbi:MAG: hypothetical protein HY510_06695 [Acidobacteria bacterium]|nr:hypothetical protein [Acidobacteriota bacterium]
MRERTRKVRRVRAAPGVLLSFLLAAPTAGCAGDEEPVAKPDFETQLVLKNASGKESNEFRSGEPITLVVTIRNRADEARALTLPSSQTHDCLVYAGKDVEVWRWSSGRMFAQVITELTFARGEARSFTVTWDQTDRKGVPVLPGEYQAVGLVPVRAPGSRSGPVIFTIRPSAANRSDR